MTKRAGPELVVVVPHDQAVLCELCVPCGKKRAVRNARTEQPVNG